MKIDKNFTIEKEAILNATIENHKSVEKHIAAIVLKRLSYLADKDNYACVADKIDACQNSLQEIKRELTRVMPEITLNQ